MSQKYSPHKKFMIVRSIQKVKHKKSACMRYDISYQSYLNWLRILEKNSWDWKSLTPKSRRPKSHPRTTKGRVVSCILALRKKGYGRDYIVAMLERAGFTIGSSAVEGVLKRNNRWMCKRKRKPKRYTKKFVSRIKRPGEYLQLDVKHLGSHSGEKWYQYTIVDLYTRMTFRYAYNTYTADYTIDFVKRAMKYFPFKFQTIQTDNGVEFTYDKMTLYEKEHPFDIFCREQTIQHRLTPVATPRYNGVVENVHGRDEADIYSSLKRGLSISIVKCIIRDRNTEWNFERLHSSLGYVTPLERLNEYQAKRGRPQFKYVSR